MEVSPPLLTCPTPDARSSGPGATQEAPRHRQGPREVAWLQGFFFFGFFGQQGVKITLSPLAPVTNQCEAPHCHCKDRVPLQNHL